MSDRPITSPHDGPADTPQGTGAIPDAHRGEPLPPAQEGMRPEADPSLAMPAAEEERGPLGGLLHGAATAAKSEVTNGDAEAESARLGFEPEGIESGQLFGLGLATILSVLSLCLVVYFLFYLPKRQATFDEATAVPSDRYVELRDARTAAAEQLTQYALNEDSTYRMPIDAAMRAVAADYADRQPNTRPSTGAAPSSWNLNWVLQQPPRAVQRAEPVAAPAALPLPASGLPAAGAIPDEGVPAGAPVAGPRNVAPARNALPSSPASPIGGGTGQ